MVSVETIIPDNKGNHLVVVLYFYDDNDKTETFQIPKEFAELDIADVNINKLEIDKPLGLRAFFGMCQWLMEQFLLYPNAVFSFICSTDPLDVRHSDIRPEQYRWNLFELLFTRNKNRMSELGIHSKNIAVGPEGCQTYAKVIYRDKHLPIIHLVTAHLDSKYSGI